MNKTFGMNPNTTNLLFDQVKNIVHKMKYHQHLLIYDTTVKHCTTDILNIFKDILINHYFVNETSLTSLKEKLKQMLELRGYFNQAITVFGDVVFIKEVLTLAKTMDELMNQRGYFTYSHKWIIIPNTECSIFSHELKPFYNAICIEHTNTFSNTDLLCDFATELKSIKTI